MSHIELLEQLAKPARGASGAGSSPPMPKAQPKQEPQEPRRQLDEEDSLQAFRGVMVSVMISGVFWAVVAVALVVMIR